MVLGVVDGAIIVEAEEEAEDQVVVVEARRDHLAGEATAAGATETLAVI